MVGFRPGIVRCRRLPGSVSGLAMAIGLLVAACGPAQTTATGTATAHGTAKPSSSANPRSSSAADCASAATCYTPQQLEAAYGVQPLLRRGIDGRGETVVVPELAETQPNPPQLNAALQADADHHVTVVAATGDTGAAGEPCALIDALGGSMSGFTPRKEVGLVASDPLVLSAGGTTLDASHTTGAWAGETARGLPDVAADGDPSPG